MDERIISAASAPPLNRKRFLKEIYHEKKR
jgi:hypothetical protein